MSERTIRIGCASGFWGDSSLGAPQLVHHGEIDYLVFDYLAELTMSILAGARLKNPSAGYATDFVDVAMKSTIGEIARKGIRVISNAGGVNPRTCAEALAAVAREAGVEVAIAVVEGDDVMSLLPELAREGVIEFQTGAPLPKRPITANAYLGALPVAAALAAGADVVITGRCVDSAVTLGALMHEFGWTSDEYDKLAAGSLAGHLLECGAQATGGLHTDWESVPDWPTIGYPIVEVASDGSFVVTKPVDTGGLVSRGTVGEQILYEIGDPAAYLLPDVTCDFRNVTLASDGEHRVRVTGARGRAPTSTYKVSSTYLDGFKCTGTLAIVGFDAVAKARRTGESLLARTRTMFAERGWEDYSGARVEVIGGETVYGPHSQATHAREVLMHLSVAHPRKEALELFRRELAAPGTSWSPGTTGGGGRPSVAPSIKQFALLLHKGRLAPRVTLGEQTLEIAQPPGDAHAPPADALASIVAAPAIEEPFVEVPLIALAYGRSGDKGDTSNIGIMARAPEYLPIIAREVTAERVAAYLAHLVRGKVTRYELPGIDAFNFVCERALDGGGMASLRFDALGKGMAQILLSLPIRIPTMLERSLNRT